MFICSSQHNENHQQIKCTIHYHYHLKATHKFSQTTWKRNSLIYNEIFSICSITQYTWNHLQFIECKKSDIYKPYGYLKFGCCKTARKYIIMRLGNMLHGSLEISASLCLLTLYSYTKMCVIIVGGERSHLEMVIFTVWNCTLKRWNRKGGLKMLCIVVVYF